MDNKNPNLRNIVSSPQINTIELYHSLTQHIDNRMYTLSGNITNLFRDPEQFINMTTGVGSQPDTATLSSARIIGLFLLAGLTARFVASASAGALCPFTINLIITYVPGLYAAYYNLALANFIN